MGIFDSMENMFITEETELPAQQMEAAAEQNEFTPEQLEAQEQMKELGKLSAESTEASEFGSREAVLDAAIEEYDTFGRTYRLKQMLEKNGISEQEFMDYSTEKLLEKADRTIEKTRAILSGKEQGEGGDHYSPSFGGKYSVEIRAKQTELKRAVAEGNQIAIKRITEELQKLYIKDAQS